MAPTIIVRCHEHERISLEQAIAQQEFQAAHDMLMTNPPFVLRHLARGAVSAAQRKIEECRVALRAHVLEHQCMAAASGR